jgi:aromatic ring-opening dioxygenase LigB subunit
VPLVFAAIAPHGGIAIQELCSEAEAGLAAATTRGLEELGRRFEDAAPEAIVVVTPHSVHVAGSIGVVVARGYAGSLAGANGSSISLICPSEQQLAVDLLQQLWADGVSAVGLNVGEDGVGNGVMPLDWGALIPLWFMGGRAEPPVPIVLMTPARDLSGAEHVLAGRALAAAAGERRIAFIASADHGHAHVEDGPYGFHPASAEYDALIHAAVSDNRLADLLALDPEFVEAASADSWWQILMLHGAVGDAFGVELLSYEVPTYFGMMCAAFSPAA